MRITSAYLYYIRIDIRNYSAYNKYESKIHILDERRKIMKINALKVQILMGERGLTIKRLAELSGVSRQTISCIISGKGCTPQVAYKIATALEQELEEIVRKEDVDG